MKFTVNMECTPEEARAFFGLPDVAPMQEALMKEVQERTLSAVKSMDPESVMRQWLPMSIQAYDQFQKMFWSSMGASVGGMDEPSRKRG